MMIHVHLDWSTHENATYDLTILQRTSYMPKYENPESKKPINVKKPATFLKPQRSKRNNLTQEIDEDLLRAKSDYKWGYDSPLNTQASEH